MQLAVNVNPSSTPLNTLGGQDSTLLHTQEMSKSKSLDEVTT